MFKKCQVLLWEGLYYAMIHPLERNIFVSVMLHRLNIHPWIFQARVLEWGAIAFSDSFDLLDILQVLTRRSSSKDSSFPD